RSTTACRSSCHPTRWDAGSTPHARIRPRSSWRIRMRCSTSIPCRPGSTRRATTTPPCSIPSSRPRLDRGRPPTIRRCAGVHGGPVDLGTLLPVWSAFPFAGILLSIALCPLVAPAFWHHHFGKVAAGWSVLFAVPFVLRFGASGLHELLHVAIVDYVPFL